MTKLNTFDIYAIGSAYLDIVAMSSSPCDEKDPIYGEWVRYEEAIAIIKELRSKIANWEKAIKALV